MLNSYNPYNVISLDMSSKDKANNKAYMGTRLFPVSFQTTGSVIPNAYNSCDSDYPLPATAGESQNYDYSIAQLESPTRVTQIETTTVRAGSLLIVPWLLTYGFNHWQLTPDNVPELITELKNIQEYIAENNLVLNQELGDEINNSGDPSGYVAGIAADGTLHVVALDLQPKSDNSAFQSTK